jgi:hypothetical protein
MKFLNLKRPFKNSDSTIGSCLAGFILRLVLGFCALLPSMSFANENSSISPWGTAQHEVQVSSSSNGQNILAAWSDSKDARVSSWNCAFSFSNDSGLSWQSTRMEKSLDYTFSANPSVAVDDAGNMYVVCMLADNSYKRGELILRTSKDNGKSWGSWQSILKITNGIPDRPKIAAGNDGSVYIVYTHVDPSPLSNHDSECAVDMKTSIQLLSSKDNGITWTGPRKLSVDRPSKCSSIEGDQGGAIRVGQKNEILVSWAGYYSGKVYFTESLDGGRNFKPLKDIQIPDEIFNDPPCTELSQYNNQLVISVHRGHAIGNVYLILSMDYGLTWLLPQIITKQGTNASPAFDHRGFLHLIWTEIENKQIFTRYSTLSSTASEFHVSHLFSPAGSKLPLDFELRGNSDLGSYQNLVALPNDRYLAAWFDWSSGWPILKTSTWLELPL